MSPAASKPLAPFVTILIVLVIVLAGLMLRREQQPMGPVRFGAVVPLSGNMAAQGNASEAGLLLAKKEIAENPGVYAPIRIFVGDSQLDPVQGQRVAEALIEQDVDALFSSFSYVTNGVNAIAKEAKIPLFYDSCNCGFAEDNPFAFQLFFDPRKECRAIAEHFLSEGVVTAAFLGQDVPYAKYCYEALQDVFGAENVIITTEASDVRFDYAALLISFKNGGAGFVVSVPAVNDFAALFADNERSGARLPIACFEGACLTSRITSAVGDAALDPVIGFGFEIQDDFRARMADAGVQAEEQVIGAAAAHDAVLYAARAAYVCGSTETSCITAALGEIDLPDAAIVATGFGADHILDYTSAYQRRVDGARSMVDW